MPQLNNGIVPGGAIGTELTQITRRAFIPHLVVQIYKAAPTLSMLFRNAQRAAGGLSQITVPVQGNSFVNWSWSDYSGSFPQPTVNTAITNAEFNLNLGVVPIPFLGMEALIQSTETVIPRLKAIMADAKTVAIQALGSAIFTNNSASNNVLAGLPQAYDDGTNVATYGGLGRTANPFWKGQYYSGAGAVLTKAKFTPLVHKTMYHAGGEAPDMIIMSLQDWSTLETDFQAAEVVNLAPGSNYGPDQPVNTGFRAFRINNVPVFADLFCPVGTAYMINSKYFAMYLWEQAAFAFSGFYSTIPNLQIGNVGLMISVLQAVCTKPVSGAQFTGITGGQSF